MGVIAIIPDEAGLAELLNMIRDIREADLEGMVIFAETAMSARIFARINGFSYVHYENDNKVESFSKRYSYVRCYEKGTLEHLRAVLIKERVNIVYAFNPAVYRDAFVDMDIDIIEMPVEVKGGLCP